MANEREHHIREYIGADGLKHRFLFTDRQYLLFVGINKAMEAMREVAQKIDYPQPSATGGCCQQSSQKGHQRKPAKREYQQ
jgi:hypothetical protein